MLHNTFHIVVMIEICTSDWLISGGSKRSLPQSGADSPAGEQRSGKRLKSLERVLSVGTVLQCVDRRCDREGPFDAAVGQRPPTVHEVTQGDCGLQIYTNLCPLTDLL